MTAWPKPAEPFPRKPLPKRFCHLDRLLHALEARGLDGIVATVPQNVYYLTAWSGAIHAAPRPPSCSRPPSRTPRSGPAGPAYSEPARPSWVTTPLQRSRSPLM